MYAVNNRQRLVKSTLERVQDAELVRDTLALRRGKQPGKQEICRKQSKTRMLPKIIKQIDPIKACDIEVKNFLARSSVDSKMSNPDREPALYSTIGHLPLNKLKLNQKFKETIRVENQRNPA